MRRALAAVLIAVPGASPAATRLALPMETSPGNALWPARAG